MRVAAVDCGTNSLRLLVADVGADGRLRPVRRDMQIVRLGQGVDRTGRLAAAALERTAAGLRDYRAEIQATGAERVRLVATSATRDASNADEFAALVRGILGVEPEVATGDEEAQLSFRGAVSGLPGVDGELVLADIGGGSTELVRGRPGGELRARSLDIGAVRLTERHLATDPPTAAEIAAARADADAALDSLADAVPLTGVPTLVGVAGTITTVAAIVLGLTGYDSAAIHGARLAAAEVDAECGRLVGLSVAQRRAIPVMHPGRADVIGGGALILQALLARTGVEDLTVSEHDILDGIALGLVDPPS